MDLKVNRRKNDQYGQGQLSHLLEGRSWGEAFPVCLLSGWTWLRSWIGEHRDRLERTPGHHAEPPGSSAPNALFVGLARVKFGLGMAPVGAAPASSSGFCMVPASSGARLYLMNGMASEAARELEGWRPQGLHLDAA